MIPAQAFGLKKYLCGTLVSKTADKEQTAAALGHSEELRVQYPPCQTVPEVIQRAEQASEITPARTAERSRDVLPDKPARTELTYRPNILPHESGGTVKTGSGPCDAEGLAGASPDHKVG